MFYLLATILLNTLISAILKLFPRYKIDAFQAIVVNYWVCVITGSIYIGRMTITAGSARQPWFVWAILLGAGFISIFNLIAWCTRIDGITTTTIANKLSLVIPVLFSIFLYREQAGMGKIAGICLAFPAVYLTSRVKSGDKKAQNFFWPALLFILSGLLDTLVKYIQAVHLPKSPDVQSVFTTHAFAAAGVIGLILILVLTFAGKIKLHPRNIVAGICLGIPNYFSIYYLIRMLNSNFLQSSAAIPVNNIGVLVSSSLMAILLFREKVTALRVVGLLLAAAAILLIAFGDINGRAI